MTFKIVNIFLLITICFGSVALILPIINNNINDPNLIVYFNHDEGYLMDLIWFYYSGEKRASYQMDLDYGLEMVYLSDLCRLIFSKFTDFTPGTFVLILRWIHLASWIGALIALWQLIGCHFGKGWQQILAVILLAVRPAFNYLSNNLKPEPLVLLFMIIGLNYILKMVEKPSMKYLLISISCASIAFVVKFSGVFLLPAIIAALYFGYNHKASNFNKVARFFNFRIKNLWIFPLLVSIPLITAPVLAIFFYVRKTTGFTYYEESGFMGSLLKNKIIFLFWIIGAICMLASFVVFIIDRKNTNPRIIKIIKEIKQISSYAILVIGLFLCSLLLFGFRWLTIPRHFLDIYVTHVREVCGGEIMGNIHTMTDFWGVFFKNIIYKFKSFDIIILVFFGLYLFLELFLYKNGLNKNKLQLNKRLTLLVFVAPLFLLMLSIGRFDEHHMLPFFTCILILIIQGICMFIDAFDAKKLLKNVVLSLAGIFLLVDIAANGTSTIKSRMYEFNQKEDVAFVIAEWFKKNVSLNTQIVADNYMNVYIPSEYKHIRIFNGQKKDGAEQLRDLVNAYHPQIVYYNAGWSGDTAMPQIKSILPDKKVRLLKIFYSGDGRYQRYPGGKFIVYEIL